MPVGDGPTIGAGLAPRSSVALAPAGSCRCTTARQRIDFLETADAFLERMPAVHRVEGTTFETGDLPAAERPLAVVPAAP